MPRELQPPLSEEQLRGWATDLRNWRDTEITADLAFLDAAAGNAVVDSQHVARLRHWLADSWLRRISEVDGAVRARIESGVLDGQRIADFILETKADDRDQVVNRILGKGRFDDNMARLRDGAHATAMAGVYDQAMAVPVPSDRAAQSDKMARAIAHLQRLAVTALDAVRMPTAATTDAELLRIAADTLRKPDYGVKGWERLVINSDKVRQEARQAWVQPGTVSTTISYYHYVWDQFQVTTAEKVGDEVWLFFNLLKHYHSGDPTKPIGRWVLSQRFESTRILLENLDK